MTREDKVNLKKIKLRNFLNIKKLGLSTFLFMLWIITSIRIIYLFNKNKAYDILNNLSDGIYDISIL